MEGNFGFVGGVSKPTHSLVVSAFSYFTQYTANDYGQTQVPERWINNQLYGECILLFENRSLIDVGLLL